MPRKAEPGSVSVLLTFTGLGGLCAASVATAADSYGVASYGPGEGANDAVRRQDIWSQDRALHSRRSRRRPRPAVDDAEFAHPNYSARDHEGMFNSFNSFSLEEQEPSSYYHAICPPRGGRQQRQRQPQDFRRQRDDVVAAAYVSSCEDGYESYGNDEPSDEQQLSSCYSDSDVELPAGHVAGPASHHYYPGRGRNAAQSLAQFQGVGRSSFSSFRAPSPFLHHRHQPSLFDVGNSYSSSGPNTPGGAKRRRRVRGLTAASSFPTLSPAVAATAAAAAGVLVKTTAAAALALAVLAPLAAALSSHWAYFVAGGICASVSHTAAVPLDVIKTRIQCAPPGMEYRGTLDALVRIVQSEGARVLFCGAGATLVGYAFQGSLKFGFFEYLKPVFTGLFVRGGRGAAPVLSILIAASVTAEIVGSLALTPLEAARIRLVADAHYAPGLRSGIARMVSEEGVAALTRGLPAVLAKQIPYTVTKLVSFDYLVRSVASWASRNGAGAEGGGTGFGTGVGVTVACAMVAGVLSSLASQPGDTLLSALNSEGRKKGVAGGFDELMSDSRSEDGSGSASGSEDHDEFGVYCHAHAELTGSRQQQEVEPVAHAMGRIAREAGFLGLFRGTGARMMHVTSIVTVQLLIYQSIKTMVGIGA